MVNNSAEDAGAAEAAPGSVASAVEVTGLTVHRGRRTVFDGIDLTVPRGRVTGLLGPSGCGKTTLMRTLVGVQAGVAGEVRVLGEPAGSKALRRRVSYATQAASVYDDFTVLQNLRYFASVLRARSTHAEASLPRESRGRATARARDDAERVMEVVGLTAHARQRVESLSGGQRGRVSLAVALLGEPELIVLDEPTVGLDPVLRAELWELFRRLAEGGATLLVSSHVMDEALRCDRLLLMRDGRVVADTTPRELLESTGTDDPEAAFLAVIAAQGEQGGQGARPHARHADTAGGDPR